ncbi:molybdopterin converting factor subunit 1 [Oceanibacterium hippocampi]|uniref:Molybdopterin synthase sulfur carrier subunit n=1 Tax=Oceanibacterium hippocampi TaxID=745714 RepID=A0A1Y5TYW4_9PROT|nr:molybdopterin converting factor subunit 1 [Oceanibacterium hippocampi]SLN74464.1 Molybdopterin synthase sulfur carrier subunit [Oceanibacterium hippocampi]
MKLLYFAWIREKIGKAEEEIVLPAGVTTVSGLIDWLTARAPGYAAAFADRDIVRTAVNMEYVRGEHPLSESDEVAFFPPVTGG